MDENGILIGTYRYNAYGKILEVKPRYWTDTQDPILQEYISILNLNPIRYKSYYYDTESRMYYLNSRYYHPLLCRFITPDEFENIDIENKLSYNIYAYCNNNPVNGMDPTGHFVISSLIIGALITGAIVGGIVSGVSGVVSGDRGLTLVGDIFGGALVGAALGLATSIGGAVAAGAISGGAAVGAFFGTTALSFVAGGGQSALNQFTHDRYVDWGKAAIAGGLTSLQSMASFRMGAAMRYCGMWNTLGRSEFTGSIKMGLVFSKTPAGLARGLGMYLERNVVQVVGRTVLKNVFTIPYTILKFFI